MSQQQFWFPNADDDEYWDYMNDITDVDNTRNMSNFNNLNNFNNNNMTANKAADKKEGTTNNAIKESPKPPYKPRIVKKKLDRLKEILSLQAESYDTDAQVSIVYHVLKMYKEAKGIKDHKEHLRVYRDGKENYYIIKGKGIKIKGTKDKDAVVTPKEESIFQPVSNRVYPAVVAHLDQVHDFADNYQIHQQGDVLFGMGSRLSKNNYRSDFKQLPTGGDDLSGVWLALEMLIKYDNMKVAFFQDEEVGCQGSKQCDIKFFQDCTFIFQGDRNHKKNDFINRTNGINVMTPEFMEASKPIMEKFGYAHNTGSITDVGALLIGGAGCCAANIACGYHNAHRDTEIVLISQSFLCLEFMSELIASLSYKRWEITKEVMSPPVAKYTPPVRHRNYNGGRNYNGSRNYNTGAPTGTNSRVNNPLQRYWNSKLGRYVHLSTKTNIKKLNKLMNIPLGKTKLIDRELFLDVGLSSAHFSAGSFELLPKYKKGKLIGYNKDEYYMVVKPKGSPKMIEITRLKTKDLRKELGKAFHTILDFPSYSPVWTGAKGVKAKESPESPESTTDTSDSNEVSNNKGGVNAGNEGQGSEFVKVSSVLSEGFNKEDIMFKLNMYTMKSTVISRVNKEHFKPQITHDVLNDYPTIDVDYTIMDSQVEGVYFRFRDDGTSYEIKKYNVHDMSVKDLILLIDECLIDNVDYGIGSPTTSTDLVNANSNNLNNNRYMKMWQDLAEDEVEDYDCPHCMLSGEIEPMEYISETDVAYCNNCTYNIGATEFLIIMDDGGFSMTTNDWERFIKQSYADSQKILN